MTTLPKQDAPRAPRPAAGMPAVERTGQTEASPPPMIRPQGPLPNLSAGTIIDGRYRIIRFLNQGGNGVVHEVEHLRTGRRLAMKSLVDDASAARLEQEARATSIMKNPHVVKITDMGPGTGARGAPYLVMELLEGQTLRELLDDAGQLPLEMTVNIALQVCECLAEAHERSVIHRDLKPDNLFLVKSAWPGQYDVVVLDFGVMKVAGEGPIPKGSLTRTGSTVGTPYYMSLEQLRNSSAVDARADIYSLGVVLYECLSGRKPFVADTIGDLVYALCSGPATPLARLRPDLPADVCDAVMRALKMNREDRQPSMADVGAALLAHGHPAFGLWLRGEGTPPMSAGPLAAALRDAAPKPAAVAPAPPTPDEGEGTTVTGVAAVHAPIEDPHTTEGVDTAPVPVMRRGDRETPTEMYKPAFGGDRDTPTRALPAPSLHDIDAAAARSAAAQAQAQAQVQAQAQAQAQAPGMERAMTYRLDQAPRFGAGTDMMIGQDPRVQAVMRDTPPGAQQTARFDALATPPRFDAPHAPMPAGGQAGGLALPPKPGWQQSLDRALAAVSGLVESIVRKVRAQPRPVQIAIVVAIVLAAVLVLVLVFVLASR